MLMCRQHLHALFVFLCSWMLHRSAGFSVLPSSIGISASQPSCSQSQQKPQPLAVLQMGLFDGITKAFTNADFKVQDQRVRASHILLKGSDIDASLDKIKTLLAEINDRAPSTENMGGDEQQQLVSVFAELARSNSQCSSATQGGDLGLFAPGVMAQEFDDALFPPGPATAPPVGSVIGPVVTDFGIHLILVTQREEDKNQVEEKLARND